MTHAELLALTDRELSSLYSYWSERACGSWWMGGGEGEFVAWALVYSPPENWGEIEAYQLKTLAAIRAIVKGEP